VADDSVAEREAPVQPVRDTPAADAPAQRDPIRPAPPRDTATRAPRDTSTVRPPIGDPAALPRPPVTLPRPEPDSAGDRP
jgi:hypothetical protein